MANSPKTLGELNDLLSKLQALRATMVRDARDELAKTPAQAELINQYIADAETLLMDALKSAPGEPEDSARAWLARSWEIAHPWGSGGAYVNFPDPDLDEWDPAYHGSNRERLLSIAADYDPEGVFRSCA